MKLVILLIVMSSGFYCAAGGWSDAPVRSSISHVLRNVLNTQGRTSRSVFTKWTISTYPLVLAAALLDIITGLGPVLTVWTWILLGLLTQSAYVRRGYDLGESWAVIGRRGYDLRAWKTEGLPLPNEYGEPNEVMPLSGTSLLLRAMIVTPILIIFGIALVTLALRNPY